MIISREYVLEWQLGDETYYPVDDVKSEMLYETYIKLANKEENVIFGARPGECKYYDVDATILSALKGVRKN